jgi:hypothetical protein
MLPTKFQFILAIKRNCANFVIIPLYDSTFFLNIEIKDASFLIRILFFMLSKEKAIYKYSIVLVIGLYELLGNPTT